MNNAPIVDTNYLIELIATQKYISIGLTESCLAEYLKCPDKRDSYKKFLDLDGYMRRSRSYLCFGDDIDSIFYNTLNSPKLFDSNYRFSCAYELSKHVYYKWSSLYFSFIGLLLQMLVLETNGITVGDDISSTKPIEEVLFYFDICRDNIKKLIDRANRKDIIQLTLAHSRNNPAMDCAGRRFFNKLINDYNKTLTSYQGHQLKELKSICWDDVVRKQKVNFSADKIKYHIDTFYKLNGKRKEESLLQFNYLMDFFLVKQRKFEFNDIPDMINDHAARCLNTVLLTNDKKRLEINKEFNEKVNSLYI